MADVHDKATRSRNMAAIKSKDTKPEVMVRKSLFAQGYRYRKNVKDLPGKPDIVLPKYRTCIFIHGCFWHMHDDCHLFKLPESRRAFWQEKLLGNKKRDQLVKSQLTTQGWKIIIVWECALKGKSKLPIDVLAARISELIKTPAQGNILFEIR